MNISEVLEKIKSQGAESVVAEALEAAKNSKDLNIFLTINESAIDKAKEIDNMDEKDRGRLAGVPFAVKDNYLTEGIETTAASNILKGFIPSFSATAVKRLEDEGAIMIGKVNLDSFAHGASTENSDFGPTKNPLDPEYVPGGSSGGSAAAVAADIVPFALGSDTGGSIRLPASFTGTVGLKPTYGLVSRYGVIAMASSTDVMGPITKTVEDAALVLDIMAGEDGKDATVIEREKTYIPTSKSLKGLKFGLVKEHMGDGVEGPVKKAILKVVNDLKEAGAEIVDISIPELDAALAVYYTVMPAEVSSNLSRYDGVKFGYTADSGNLEEMYTNTRGQGFNKEVKRRIMIGSYVLSSGYYDAYYKKAQTVRTLLIQKFAQAYNKVDFLIGPTSPTPAFKLGENSQNPLQMYLCDIMTVAHNLTGDPAINIPIAKDGKLPIGLQIAAHQKKDKDLLEVAKAIEKIVGYS